MKARLFGTGLPATGEAAELRVADTSIVVQSGAGEYRVAIAALRMRAIGFDEAGVEFAWDGVDGARLVHILDKESVQSLAAEPALATAPQLQLLQRGQRRKTLRRSVGWTLVATFLLLPLLLLLVFLWQADRIASMAAARIPLSQEVALGEQAFASLRPSLQLDDSGPAAQAVRSLGEKLSRGSIYNYRFHVAKTDVVNAFALPGGIIVVNTALIEATRRPEELAGVLAHEIQHVELRHSLQAIVKELGLRGLWLLVTGDAGSTLAGAAVLQLTSLKFSRDAETQADARGFDALVTNNIDPHGMIEFFDVMTTKSEVSPPLFLSTHPASAGRKEALNEKEQALRGRAFTPLPFAAWPPR